MATSRTALQMPRTARAAALATTPGLTMGRVTANESAAALTLVTAPLPNRAISHPAVGSAATAPTAMASRRKPSLPSLRASRDLSSGIWGSQLARTSPLRRKQTDTARRAATGAALLARFPLTAMVPDSVSPPVTEADDRRRLCLPDYIHVSSPARTVKRLKILSSRIDLISAFTSRVGWDPRA